MTRIPFGQKEEAPKILENYYAEFAETLTGKVDFIICETMSTAEEGRVALEMAKRTNLPVWLSISCVMNAKNDKVMLGYSDSIDTDTHIYESLDVAINNFSKLHKGPILIAHSDINVTGQAIKTAKKNFNGILGVYPNRGYYEKPHWKFVDNITPNDYLEKAKSWVKDGARIVGGCCGVGVEEIKAISILKD